ncbi:MAG: hypothetical protein ACJAVR_003932 [Paracoccaceae bacterium]|jgi:hypothetical protein
MASALGLKNLRQVLICGSQIPSSIDLLDDYFE